MQSPHKILIVEDEMVIGANISLLMTGLGYEVTGLIPRGEEAIAHVRENKPDIVLLDIQLKGEIDGIETAQEIRKENDLPIIFLTANADDAHFEKAKSTRPVAFLSKPYKKKDLQRAVALAVEALRTDNVEARQSNTETAETSVLGDRIFVRVQDEMVKLFVKDILYVEADRNYCKIFTLEKAHLVVSNLKELTEKLPVEKFQRIHRSFVINLEQLDAVSADHVVIQNKTIPVSRSYKDDLQKRLRLV